MRLCSWANGDLQKRTTDQEGQMLFVVDRDVPGVGLEQMQQARRRAVDASARFTAQGQPVVYLRSLWMPGDGRALCVFEAASGRLVEEVNRVARFPFLRMAEAMDLADTPRGLSGL